MIDDERQSLIKKTSSKQTALHCGVGLLARREHSEFELRQKLLTREFSTDDIDTAVDRLLEKDYLSDSRFAQSRCRYRANRGYGWLYIANELKQKGVCSTIIQQLQKNCEIDWYLQAELAYNKRFGEFREKDTLSCQKSRQKEKAKRSRFLQYRGFSMDDVFSLVNDE
ncbi:MAG: hypothetical protein COB83_01880 [Gammaproteobacteria bacterium]|nr:MAG: hypothetical protein COB83_01880 [Gammaproteobacteria bacterium]